MLLNFLSTFLLQVHTNLTETNNENADFTNATLHRAMLPEEQLPKVRKESLDEKIEVINLKASLKGDKIKVWKEKELNTI